MAQILKDGSVKGQGYAVDVVKKPETMIIPARELVQILAKVLCTIFSSSFYRMPMPCW
jgi:hypothetical protein